MNSPLEMMDGRELFPDFYLRQPRLIIEIDGSIHWTLALDRDCKRDFMFEERGCAVLHIANKDADEMTADRLKERILAVYPTFPIPSQIMDHNLKLYRERFNIQGPKRFKIGRKKKTNQEKHLYAQHLEWKAMQEARTCA